MTGEIIGGGFLAGYLRHHLAPEMPATVLAAGVSNTSETSPERFRREAVLVSETARRCREHGRLMVFLSSAATGLYGREGEGREDQQVEPVSPYGKHKLAMERLVADSGAQWLTLRLSHVVGPRQNPAQLLPSLVRQVRSGTVTVYRGARRDLMDVRHFATVLDRLLALGVCGRTVNVASGVAFPVDQIVAALEAAVGRSAERAFLDVPVETLSISNQRMRTLVPEATGFGFGPGYLDGLVSRYVGRLDGERAVPAFAGGV
ncbi:NAD-dependent epimerase/dehydratase family protein [Streptomyces xanthophaeus]|uniref:NAD-dependent epimerase n=1 Tax=Streptomyces xanthophaeus TaxID=67385 RepID=A0A919H250_9ACTN|nr:SDR family oxidoreductase [Streptomyces xanthophaeus]WST25176.1 SDR family oxidoreductase [Streptomyces xanthophaeus]WST59850.1 SDR family oxidoreductase [Streptomyces xanthophaeus]GHI86846.1 NAD-dependent epimerase [Streptomyces xanthophaeus]